MGGEFEKPKSQKRQLEIDGIQNGNGKIKKNGVNPKLLTEVVDSSTKKKMQSGSKLNTILDSNKLKRGAPKKRKMTKR